MTRNQMHSISAVIISIVISTILLVSIIGATDEWQQRMRSAMTAEQPKLVMAEAYCLTKDAAEVAIHSVEDYGADGYRASVLLPLVACYDADISRHDRPIVAVLKKQAFSVQEQEFGLDIWEAELSDGRTVYVCYPMFGEPV